MLAVWCLKESNVDSHVLVSLCPGSQLLFSVLASRVGRPLEDSLFQSWGWAEWILSGWESLSCWFVHSPPSEAKSGIWTNQVDSKCIPHPTATALNSPGLPEDLYLEDGAHPDVRLRVMKISAQQSSCFLRHSHTRHNQHSRAAAWILAIWIVSDKGESEAMVIKKTYILFTIINSPTVSDSAVSSRDQQVSRTESSSASSMMQEDLFRTARGEWNSPFTLESLKRWV